MSQSATHNSSTGLNACVLKVAAIVCMTAQHAAYVFGMLVPLPAECLCYFLGGFTFLIVAFLLTEGFHYTRSVKKYALRLFVFALISEIPYWLVLEHSGNVLFTLLIGLGILYAYEQLENRALFALVFICGCALSALCDWGVVGPVCIFLFHLGRRGEGVRWQSACILAAIVSAVDAFELRDAGALIAPGLCYAAGNLVCIALLALYNGERGTSLKYFFYAYYPLHIAAIGLIAHALL